MHVPASMALVYVLKCSNVRDVLSFLICFKDGTNTTVCWTNSGHIKTSNHCPQATNIRFYK